MLLFPAFKRNGTGTSLFMEWFLRLWAHHNCHEQRHISLAPDKLVHSFTVWIFKKERDLASLPLWDGQRVISWLSMASHFMGFYPVWHSPEVFFCGLTFQTFQSKSDSSKPNGSLDIDSSSSSSSKVGQKEGKETRQNWLQSRRNKGKKVCLLNWKTELVLSIVSRNFCQRARKKKLWLLITK